MKKHFWETVAVAGIIASVLIFFLPFFWPKLQLLVTPDFGRSDSWHFSFPTKFLLWQSLQQNHLPLWSAKIGAGFPLLGEGQTGIFFLPNLLLYKFLNPVVAYNLSLAAAVITLALGMYFWIKLMGEGTLLAFYAAITLAFSGMVITQLPHITLLQGFSLLPWIAGATVALAQKKSAKTIAFLAFLVSQQIFTGFPQASFITLLFCGVYYLWQIRRSRTKIKDIALMALGILLALGIGMVQILPSYEFLKNSTVSQGLTADLASYFSFPLKHLASFLNPFALGNPKFATYPPFYEFNGSIFWENTGYIGLLPLALIFLGFLPKLWRRNRAVELLFFLTILFFSFLLMLGNHSPIYLIYSFWPFNLFRVPSRFLWIFSISLIIISVKFTSLFLKSIKQRLFLNFLFVIFVIANTALLFQSWKSYHLLAPADIWLKTPQIVSLINARERVITLGAETVHNQIFLKKGWPQLSPYLFLRNGLTPDANILWGVPSHEVYAGRYLRRPTIITNLLEKSLADEKPQTAHDELTTKLLNLLSINTVITVTDTSTPDKNINRSLSDGERYISVYDNPTAFPRAYLASRITTVKTLEEALAKINSSDFKPGENVLLERNIVLPNLPSHGKIKIIEDTDTKVRIRVSDNDVLAPLVLSDTYYPGWKATVDGTQTEILAANISQRAVIVPSGTHEVIFSYQPRTFMVGAIVSIVAFVLTAFLAVFPRQRVFSHNLQKVS